MAHRWFRRFLSLCPTAIAVLWIAGIAHFRAYDPTPAEWAMVVAAAIGFAAIAQRLQRGRPMPRLPDNASPPTIAALAAAIVGVMAMVLGGTAELVAQEVVPSETAWWLRTTWHGACAFGAAYCFLLHRLLPSTGRPPQR